MREYGARERQAGGQQKGGPIDGVKAQDFLAHQLQVGRPELVKSGLARIGLPEAGPAQVAGEGVEPDIENMIGGFLRRLGNGNAPLDGGTADRKVPQAAANEGDDFIAAGFGADEAGVVLIQREQGLLVGGEAEEEVLFFGPLAGLLVIETDVAGLAELGVILEDLAALAVPAAVLAAVDGRPAVGGFGVPDTSPEGQDASGVGLVGGANKAVELDSERPPGIAKQGGDGVGILLRRDARRGGGALDVLAVFVGAGEQKGVVAAHLLVAADGVGDDGAVGVAEVRRGVDVVQRRGQEKFRHVRLDRIISQDRLCYHPANPASKFNSRALPPVSGPATD